MRGLTVKQPWAWAIVSGGKDIENRSVEWTYRGELAIHAGKAWSTRGAESRTLQKAYAKWLGFEHWNGHMGGHTAMPIDPDRDDRDRALFNMGAVIGTVQLVDVHLQYDGCCTSPWAEKSYREVGGRVRNEIVHLVLERPVAFRDPVPARGSLGLWKPNHYLRAAIDDARRAS